MGVVRYALPPVPEDKELQAKNRARNEEQKRAKEEKKAKKARKAKRQETSAKRRREAKKEGLPVLKSLETSVLEIEGAEEPHWLNQLADEEDEDEEILPAGGGIEAPEGSKARGGSETLEGLKVPGGMRVAPYIIVDDEEDGAPQGGSVPPGPQEGERAPGGGLEAPQEPVAPEGPTEPRPLAGEEVEGSVEAPRAETTIEAPAASAGETSARPTTPGGLGGAQGASSSQRSAAPRVR